MAECWEEEATFSCVSCQEVSPNSIHLGVEVSTLVLPKSSSIRGPASELGGCSLIVDRTRKGNVLAVYADSLTDFQPNAIEILKEMLQSTPLDIDEMTWIKASVPKQESKCAKTRALDE